MNRNRRISTPVASVLAGVVVALAVLGGSMAIDGAGAKADRIASFDTACARAGRPSVSGECSVAVERDAAKSGPRYVTVASADANDGVTTLIRIQGAVATY